MTPFRIVAIGGGTGLSTLLHGLKRYALEPREVEITAIVTVTDDGGSSGRLRREFDVLPPGDIRNCMVALSEDEALLSKLFQYRFSEGRGLKGHSFGNLFLTALTNLTGDFAQAVKVSSEVLASLGRIYPATSANVVLEAELENGPSSKVRPKSEKAAPAFAGSVCNRGAASHFRKPWRPSKQADLITFGPGSLFTSVIPNVLVEGIAPAIQRSRALKAYFVNLMWQPGETIGFRASDHIARHHLHAGVHSVDVAVVNTRAISARQRRKYAAQKVRSVLNDIDRLAEMGLQVSGRRSARLRRQRAPRSARLRRGCTTIGKARANGAGRVRVLGQLANLPT